MLKTKSLLRLERLRKKLGLEGQVIFDPSSSIGTPFRYTVESVPIGKDAQSARKHLREMANGRQKA